MYGEENIISRSDHMVPHLHCDFVPLTKAKNLSAKDVIGDKKRKCAGRKEISRSNARRVPFAAKFARLEPEKA